MIPWPLQSEREFFDLISIPDGDYPDKYLDSLDIYYMSFVRVGKIVMKTKEQGIKNQLVNYD
jgi:hypothetical protein